jgi:hypothetical protein
VLHCTKLLAAARPQLKAALASGTESACRASPARVYESPPAEAYGGELELPLHGTITGRKRPVDYPWNWVSLQLLKLKGEEIYYTVVTETDRSWARRLECAIEHHRDIVQSDLNCLQAECERVLRRSQSAAVLRDERYYINHLQAQLEDEHKRLRDARA